MLYAINFPVLHSALLSRSFGGPEPGAGNLISGNPQYGVIVAGFIGDNRVQGNLIGTDITGTQPLGNQTGVFVEASDDFIGGTDPGAGNLISDSPQDGVLVEGDND